MPRLPPLEPSPYKTYVETKSYYIHPRTGMRASKAVIQRLKLKPTTFVYLRRSEDHGIIEKTRVMKREIIVATAPMQDRWVSHALGKAKAYSKLWANRAGHIRVTVNGEVMEGKRRRRVKEVFYLDYHRRHWEMQARAYAGFKNFILGSVLSHLRRRGLRLSNPKASRQRIHDLEEQRAKELRALDSIPREFARQRAGKQASIEWAGEAIRMQKESRQLHASTIRIEKLGG